MAQWKGVAVLIEQTEGIVEPISWELLGKGRELADKAKQPLIAIVMGYNADEIAQEATYRGADEVILADHEYLLDYRWETYTKIGEEILRDMMPSMLIVGASHNGRDFAGRISVLMNTGLTADVVGLDVDEEGLLLGSVPGFGGSIHAIIKCPTARPQIATARPGLFEAIDPDPSRKGKIKKHKVKISESDLQTRIIKRVRVDAIDISKTDRLVAAGRGVGNDLSKIQELAELLDAAVGVTRPLCDVGLMPRDHQIGSTGVTVKPKWSLVFGASGASHFTSGIHKSDMVIAINMDKEALIFQQSDYGVVGDINEILPELLESLKARMLNTVESD